MTPSTSKCRIRIGPSGWSYPDWKGIVYPEAAGSRFDPLAYLSDYFDTIEVNSSFYRPPPPRTTTSWVKRVAQKPDFRFAFKLWQRFTHELPAPKNRNTAEITPSDLDQVKAGLDPVAQAGRLGGLLMQFPWSFRNNDASLAWLDQLGRAFSEYPLVVELRHNSWDTPEVRERLAERRINYCNIDQPVLNKCLPPSGHVTGPIGYVRLHGRRYDTWFAENTRASARYDYLYRQDELAEWVARLGSITERTESLYVFANNHYRGQGPANALQLRAMVEQRQIDVPPDMLPHFPFLADLASRLSPRSKPGRQNLFDM